MTRIPTICLLLLCAAALCAAPPAPQKLKPVTAAEADQRVAETRDFLANMLWAHTEEHWHVGEWEECIRLCRQIVALDPHFLEAYNGAAWMLWNLDRDNEAIAVYRAGIAANPDQYEIYHEFGMYYYQRKQWDQAAEQFRKSVETGAPMYFQHMLPNVLDRAGRKQEALKEWRALLKRFPDDPIAKQHIAALEQALAAQSKSP